MDTKEFLAWTWDTTPTELARQLREQRKEGGVVEIMRTCKRCGKIYKTLQKHSKVCYDCDRKSTKTYDKKGKVIRKFKHYVRLCERCSKFFKATGKRSKYCLQCRKIK